MKRYLAVVAVCLGTAAIGASNVSNGSDGKTIFLDNKCSNCHSINSLKIERTGKPEGDAKPSDLSDVGLKHKADWIAKWLQKEETLDGKKHLKKFKGNDADLTTLSNWLGTLKTKAK